MDQLIPGNNNLLYYHADPQVLKYNSCEVSWIRREKINKSIDLWSKKNEISVIPVEMQCWCDSDKIHNELGVCLVDLMAMHGYI